MLDDRTWRRNRSAPSDLDAQLGRTSTRCSGGTTRELDRRVEDGQVDHVEPSDLLDRLGARPITHHSGGTRLHTARSFRSDERIADDDVPALAHRVRERAVVAEVPGAELIIRGIPVVEVFGALPTTPRRPWRPRAQPERGSGCRTARRSRAQRQASTRPQPGQSHSLLLKMT